MNNFSLSCILDLRPGHYSSLRIAKASNTGGYATTYDGSNNLGIAYGCIIENATGGSANDTLYGNSANNTLNGSSGRDTVVYAGSKGNFTVTNVSSVCTVKDNTGGEGTDSLLNIERIQFQDRMLALDITGNGGQAYRMYQAAFNRTPDQSGLGYWISLLDKSVVTLEGVAGGFTHSAEFASLYGASPSNDTFVTKLYDNVLHRGPDQSGYQYWTGLLATGAINREQMLVNFSESSENQLQVIGAIQNGIEYIAYAA